MSERQKRELAKLASHNIAPTTAVLKKSGIAELPILAPLRFADNGSKGIPRMSEPSASVRLADSVKESSYGYGCCRAY